MTAKEIFRIWAPEGKDWVDWVRPVAFINIGDYSKAYVMGAQNLPELVFLEEMSKKSVLDVILGTGQELRLESTAIIVDLTGEEGVRYGVALIRHNFRPIPIYNGTIEQQGARATVDNQSVGMALEHWAYELKGMNIPDDARPAFLVDRGRLTRYKMEDSIYDNSWDVYPQDLPSPQYLLGQGISNVLVIGGKTISRDIKKILGKHQKKGIKIYHTNGFDKPKRKYIFQMPKWD